jgi:hypothetical protein
VRVRTLAEEKTIQRRWTARCNKRARAALRLMRLKVITCYTCGTKFDVLPWRQETAKFCSSDCQVESRRKK